MQFDLLLEFSEIVPTARCRKDDDAVQASFNIDASNAKRQGQVREWSLPLIAERLMTPTVEDAVGVCPMDRAD